MKYSGKIVHKGIAVGKVFILGKKEDIIKREPVGDIQAEKLRLNKALEKSKEQLSLLYEKALGEVGEASAAMFEVHQMMMEDANYVGAITSMIETEGINAEFAVARTGEKFSDMFSAMDDNYMKARAADVKDISHRIIDNLLGHEMAALNTDEAVIIVADDLSPSETVQIDKEKILAFVTVHGSTNSHTAVLARIMNIPALIGVDFELGGIDNGSLALVDCINGEVIFNPEPDECLAARQRIKEQENQEKLFESLKGKETETRSGKKINLYANIGGISDVGYVLENDGAGIGLMRSEFLYIEKDDFPTEEEQFEAYMQVAQAMGDKKVIIRTLDIGADKQADYLDFGNKDNPALGYRAIRICLKHPEIFKTQLRALLRASVYGNISIIYPMIISVNEVRQILKIVDEVAKELDAEGISYRIPEQGLMIETPAAVMISDELAKLVDFFSIGTNDLSQYTLAIDRQNDKLDDFYDAHHPALLKMIKIVVDNAHAEGKRVGICGELGADTELTETLIKMGIDELSVSPAMILKIRQIIRNMD